MKHTTLVLSNVLYCTEQIKAVEQFVIQKNIISGLMLMEQAGQAVFEYVQHRYRIAKKIAIFCGSGNNAGDGYVVGKLALQAGLSVFAYSVKICSSNLSNRVWYLGMNAGSNCPFLSRGLEISISPCCPFSVFRL